MSHITVPLLSPLWWGGLCSSCVIITLIVLWFKFCIREQIHKQASVLGVIMLTELVVTHVYLLFIQGTWSVADSLPLHLCRLSFIVAALSLLTKNQLLYEWSAYLGVPSGFHSIVTPELTQGTSPWMLFDYYFSHSLLIAVPIILTCSVNGRPRRTAMWKVFVAVNVLAVFVFVLNSLVKSNYMYLARKPIAGNPFLIGPWPWYIIGLEVAGVLHLLLMDVLFRVRPWRSASHSA